MDNDLEHSRIEQKNRELFKQGAGVDEEKIHPLQKDIFNVASDFTGAKIQQKTIPAPPPPKRETPTSIIFLRWFAVISVSAALSAIGYFVYQFLDPSGKPSQNNVVVELITPVGANPGGAIEIVAKVTNKNNIALGNADIVLQLPTGSYEKINDSIIPVKEVRSQLGLINSNETAEYKLNAYILGGEQEMKDIKVLLSYRFININSVFTKSAESKVRILTSPITVIVDTLKRTTAGRDMKVNVSIRSNTEVPLKNILVNLEYPKGFVFNTAEPRPVIGNNTWVIDSLERSNAQVIVVDGKFSSEGSTERIIRTIVGVSDVDKPNEISSKYQEILTPIALEAPFVNILTTYNGKMPSEVIATYGKRMTGQVTIKNTTDAPISHAIVDVALSGTGLDENSIDVSDGGIFRQETNTITWDERSKKSLTSIDPGRSIVLNFSFIPNAGRDNGQFVSNPEISTNVTVRAERQNESGVLGEVKTLSASTVKIATESEFASRLLFYSGPIKNKGEIPPKKDKSTEFTVVWNIRNTSNSLDGAEVRASIPQSVSWVGVIVPSKEIVKYDTSTHEIIWVVGSVPAGTGVGSVSPKEVAFQIILTPSKDDVGKFPNVLENQIFRARDSFTNKSIEIKARGLNTTLSTDSKADRNTGKVVE